MIDPTYYFTPKGLAKSGFYPYVHTALGYRSLSTFGGLTLQIGGGLAFVKGAVKAGRFIFRLYLDYQHDRLGDSENDKAGIDWHRFRSGIAIGTLF